MEVFMVLYKLIKPSINIEVYKEFMYELLKVNRLDLYEIIAIDNTKF